MSNLQEISLISEILPGLIWDDDKINVDSFLNLISKKYPQYIFKFKKSSLGYNFDEIEVEGLFNSDRKLKINIRYNIFIPTFFKIIENVQNKSLSIIENYKILIHNNQIELVLKLDKKLEEFDDNTSDGLYFRTEYKNEIIDLNINKSSLEYHVIFQYSNTYSIFFNNPFEKLNELLNFVSRLENSLMFHFYNAFYSNISFMNHNQNLDLNKLYFFQHSQKDLNKFHFKTIKVEDTTKLLINYLSSGASIDYLPFKYLIYYHVVEYFFEEIFVEEMVTLSKNTKDKLTLDNFIKVLSLSKQEIKKLELVLKKFISISEFQNNFYNIKLEVPETISHYNVKLPKIRLNQNDFHKDLSKRIYLLRNSIVHSKSNSKMGESLKYSENDMFFLYNEIFLIRWIAEIIVNKKILE